MRRAVGICWWLATFSLPLVACGTTTHDDGSGGGGTSGGTAGFGADAGTGGVAGSGGAGGALTGGAGGWSGGGAGGAMGGTGGAMGGTGGMTGGVGGMAGGTGGVPSEPADCNYYCLTIQTNCKGLYQQYPSVPVCKGVCAALPLGTTADYYGNTVGCRSFHAAFNNPGDASSCAAAGPAGNSNCGTSCEGYCAIMLKSCPGAYASSADCSAKCAGIKGSNEKYYTAGTTSGDSLFCRLHWATLASVDASACGNAGLSSPQCK